MSEHWDTEAVDALDGLLEDAIDDERFDKQLKVLERKQLIKVPRRRKPFSLRSGRIWEVEIGDAGRAVSIYQRILELLPGDEDALVALSRLLPRSRKIMRHSPASLNKESIKKTT